MSTPTDWNFQQPVQLPNSTYHQNMNENPYVYNPLLNEIHTSFPALLYDTGRFHTLPSVFEYVQTQIRNRYDIFSSWQRHYQSLHQNTVQSSNTVPSSNSNSNSRMRNRNRRRRQNRNRNRNLNRIQNENQNQNQDSTINISTNRNQTSAFINFMAQTMMDPFYTIILPERHFSEPVLVIPTDEQIAVGSVLQTSVGLADISCAVCQQNFTADETVRRLLPCNHQYHRDCIDTWFQRNVHCPVCRHDIREQIVN